MKNYLCIKLLFNAHWLRSGGDIASLQLFFEKAAAATAAAAAAAACCVSRKLYYTSNDSSDILYPAEYITKRGESLTKMRKLESLHELPFSELFILLLHRFTGAPGEMNFLDKLRVATEQTGEGRKMLLHRVWSRMAFHFRADVAKRSRNHGGMLR